MKAFTFAATAASLLAFSTTVYSMPSTLLSRQTLNATDLDGLTYGTSLDMEIIGPVFKDGPNITFTGTPEAFYNKVHELNPNYDTDFQDVIAAQGSEDELEGVDATAAKTFCYHDDYASTQPIKNGIKYLNSLSASCGSIRRFCTRVSCSYDSGIYLCNNQYHKIHVRCSRIAKLAHRGVSICHSGDNVQSRIRSGDGWVVDIAGTSC